jgi:NADPH:quinone reductase-like Zn-dependent oxidoreductase
MATTMRAVVLDGPGPASTLQIRKIPVPIPRPGWALIAVKTFGLNRSELHSRLGLAEGMTWPRVLGAEATGVIEACPGGEFAPGQQVAALAGGMGRVFDGGYAEYTCVPVSQVVPFASSLNWPTLGAIPVMLLTANGSLNVGLDAKAGQTLLVRGGTSSIGMLTAVLAKRLSMTVLSTTRNPAKATTLDAIGVDHVVIDGGSVTGAVRQLCPDGVDGALELVGTPTLPDTLRCVRVHGVACFTGILSNQWTVEKFYPIDYIPRGVRLTAYSGDAVDLPPTILQSFIEDVEAGQVKVPIAHVFRLEEIAEAHQAMEDGTMSGKLVVTTGL